MRPTASPLSLYLAAGYTLLAIYASLHPFAGWRDLGGDPFAFLFAAWPRYVQFLDLPVNLVAYMPLGFLWVAVLQPRLGRLGAVLLTTLCGTALSLTLEGLQNYLPTRVPSNIDVATNALGTLFGAVIGTRWGGQLLDGGRLHTLRARRVRAGAMGDAGLMLLGLWLLTQLTPETLLFGNGDLRALFGLEAPLPYSAGRFAEMEAAIVGVHTLAIALLATCIARGPERWPVLLLLAAALVLKTLVLALSLGAGRGLAWTTDGSLIGLAAGIALWLAASPLPASAQKALAALALLFATVLVNLTPDNPYLVNTWQTWSPGQFLNFHGLSKLASTLWPFLALPWLMLLRLEKHRP